MLEVCESRVWRNGNGKTASIYGAVPWTGGPGDTREDWDLEVRGWTVRDMKTGAVGCGRPPFPTRDDAQAFADKYNARGKRETLRP